MSPVGKNRCKDTHKNQNIKSFSLFFIAKMEKTDKRDDKQGNTAGESVGINVFARSLAGFALKKADEMLGVLKTEGIGCLTDVCRIVE